MNSADNRRTLGNFVNRRFGKVSLLGIFSSPEPKAHRGAYWMVQRRRRTQCSNIFSETAGPFKAKFYVEPPWEGGTKICSRHLGHMTKMAAIPIYDNNNNNNNNNNDFIYRGSSVGVFQSSLRSSLQQTYIHIQ